MAISGTNTGAVEITACKENAQSFQDRERLPKESWHFSAPCSSDAMVSCSYPNAMHLCPIRSQYTVTHQTLALLGAIVRLNFLFSSVSSMTGNKPRSLSPPKNSFPYAYPT